MWGKLCGRNEGNLPNEMLKKLSRETGVQPGKDRLLKAKEGLIGSVKSTGVVKQGEDGIWALGCGQEGLKRL